jgi:hypothetical protein
LNRLNTMKRLHMIKRVVEYWRSGYMRIRREIYSACVLADLLPTLIKEQVLLLMLLLLLLLLHILHATNQAFIISWEEFAYSLLKSVWSPYPVLQAIVWQLPSPLPARPWDHF